MDPRNYQPQDYLLGRVKLPPSINAKRQKSFAYVGDVSINNGSAGRLDIAMDADSSFLVEGIELITGRATQAADGVLVQITDNTFSTPWSNVPLPMRDVFGTGAYMHELVYPNMLTPSNTLSIQIQNNSGNNDVYYIALHGRKFYDLTDDEISFLKRRMWYQYGLQVATLTTLTTGNVFNLQIFNESDFLLKFMLSWSFWQAITAATPAGSPASSEVRCNFRDTSQDRNFYGQMLALRTVIGTFASIFNAGAGNYSPQNQTGQMRFNKAMLIRRNGAIQATLDNLSGTTMTSQVITFEGARLFGAIPAVAAV